MASSNKKVYNVAVLLFNGADILDFSGPLEILAHTLYNTDLEHPEPVFKPTTIASTPTILVGQCMTVQAGMTVSDALAKINDFDILVVPGGNPHPILEMCASNDQLVELIKAFNNSSAVDEKIILSVCTGALFLGATGVLSGLKATTHHMFLDMLRDTDKSIEVISSVSSEGKPTRYVDGGVNKQGKRVVTAGGVTCGLDAALYIVSMKVGEEAAGFVANMTEHDWKKA